ncbi:MAG: beta-galactosidase [Candidatus Cohnella colombiensis]|uniref:Beta-galactosidase n=1 Tax=Candidatus Cohnella colombiensis TaxID=3121368 RepID=A0AA95EXR3_9BACL|nr:MAG: beta-galactosidase [Cohnella sp.]
MSIHSLQLNAGNKEIKPGKLARNSGGNPLGETYGFTNFYMTRNGAPIIPVVGEFHFSRFSYLQWEEELLKMKAGGVHVIATYVFWIFHEEEEGVFDWSGSRNLRHFIDLCAKVQLPLILRIGPFCHGEVRNGGIPDWVFSKPLEIRSNDPTYLQYAKRLYRQIAKQVKGTFYREGGPVIGVQLENEYMHCGAPNDAWGYKSGVYLSSGNGGNDHLAELRHLAEEAGIRPMFFSATAWGGAAVLETDTLPMLAGYAYTPWIPNQPPSGEYIYRDLHVNPAEPVNYDTLEYPVAYCEMAGGMQVSYHARPWVSADSVEAMSLVKLASGSNLLGYYMYHGGSNPVGKHGYLNESALPKITYDYQSPLGEFGHVAPSYHRIRSLSLFLEAYGEWLAPMGTQLPEGQSTIDPTDTDSLRWCVRHRDGAGFLFLNNFQDHVDMPDRESLQFKLQTSKGEVAFPYQGTIGLKSGASAVFPFNLNIDGVEIVSATVQPLTRFKVADQAVLVFYAHEGLKPELLFHCDQVVNVSTDAGDVRQEGEVWIVHPVAGKEYSISLELVGGQKALVLVLTREEALQTYRFSLWGEERLFISNSDLYQQGEQLITASKGNELWEVYMYPASELELGVQVGSCSSGQAGVFQRYELKVDSYVPSVDIRMPSERSAMLTVDTEWPDTVRDVFLHISYDGDVAAAYVGNQMITDHIHYGDTWRIGLQAFQLELIDRELHLSITPLRKGTTHTFVNQAFVERFDGVEIAAFHQIKAVPHYVVALYRSNIGVKEQISII